MEVVFRPIIILTTIFGTSVSKIFKNIFGLLRRYVVYFAKKFNFCHKIILKSVAYSKNCRTFVLETKNEHYKQKPKVP